MTVAGVTPESAAEVTDLTVPELRDRLNGDFPFTLRELVQVGGFLRIHPSDFLVAA